MPRSLPRRTPFWLPLKSMSSSPTPWAAEAWRLLTLCGAGPHDPFEAEPVLQPDLVLRRAETADIDHSEPRSTRQSSVCFTYELPGREFTGSSRSRVIEDFPWRIPVPTPSPEPIRRILGARRHQLGFRLVTAGMITFCYGEPLGWTATAAWFASYAVLQVAEVQCFFTRHPLFAG